MQSTGRSQPAAWRASPTIRIMAGTTKMATPGTPVFATPMAKAHSTPTSHCQSDSCGNGAPEESKFHLPPSRASAAACPGPGFPAQGRLQAGLGNGFLSPLQPTLSIGEVTSVFDKPIRLRKRRSATGAGPQSGRYFPGRVVSGAGPDSRRRRGFPGCRYTNLEGRAELAY